MIVLAAMTAMITVANKIENVSSPWYPPSNEFWTSLRYGIKDSKASVDLWWVGENQNVSNRDRSGIEIPFVGVLVPCLGRGEMGDL